MTLTQLKAARRRANFTMEQMGEKLSISRVAYWKIEHGKTKLSFDNAVKISQILDTDVNSLFLDSELTNSELKSNKHEEVIK